MLALKNWPKVQTSLLSRDLLDLPDELLDLVLFHLYTDNGCFIRDVVPSSLTCRRLRKAAAPILFHTISIRLTWRYVDRRSFNILLNFDSAPHTFSSLIRHVKQDDSYVFRADGCEDLRLSNELVRGLSVQGLRTLISVRKISVGCCNSALLHLMRQAFPDKAFQVIIEGCSCSRLTTDSGSLCNLVEMCKSANPHRFALAVDSQRWSCDLEPFLSQGPEKLQALSWSNPSAQSFSLISHKLALLASLEELHLREPNNLTFTSGELLPPQLKNLKRLSVLGAGLCSATLRTINQITSLESLRLNSTIDTIFHSHLRNHSFDGLPYLRLPNLQSLEIRYISRYLSIEHIIPSTPTLTHLRLEYHNRNERLTSYDLRWIARNTPNLHTLELNVGPLANLWHPTAIAGVDLDVDVYSMLEALSSFKNLQTLRMFPSYWHSSASGGYLHFSQPVSDNQAVRIFHHLRLSCANLTLLIIANSLLDYRSRNDVFSRGLNGEPVKWIVRSLGTGGATSGRRTGGATVSAGKTLLLTHEAKKMYHLEQVWEGDRRLTMNTVRHCGVRRHFDEIERGWVLPMYELPFDEPRACVAVGDGEYF